MTLGRHVRPIQPLCTRQFIDKLGALFSGLRFLRTLQDTRAPPQTICSATPTLSASGVSSCLGKIQGQTALHGYSVVLATRQDQPRLARSDRLNRTAAQISIIYW